MIVRHKRLVLMLVLGFAPLIGCASSDSKQPASKSDAGEVDAGASSVSCPASAVTADDFHVNLRASAKDKHVSATLYEAVPVVPERYNNTWTIDIIDAEGKPAADAMITRAQAEMPYHVHPPRPATNIMKMPEPGRFQVGLYLTMRGYFKITFHVTSLSAGTSADGEDITYEYCLQ